MGGFCERMVCVVAFFLCTLCDSWKHFGCFLYITRHTGIQTINFDDASRCGCLHLGIFFSIYLLGCLDG